MIPTIGRTVIVRGPSSNGAVQHPAVITRVWSSQPTSRGPVAVNLTVFPDQSAPMNYSSVMLWHTKEEAMAAQGGQSGSIQAHWPEQVA